MIAAAFIVLFGTQISMAETGPEKVLSPAIDKDIETRSAATATVVPVAPVKNITIDDNGDPVFTELYKKRYADKMKTAVDSCIKSTTPLPRQAFNKAMANVEFHLNVSGYMLCKQYVDKKNTSCNLDSIRSKFPEKQTSQYTMTPAETAELKNALGNIEEYCTGEYLLLKLFQGGKQIMNGKPLDEFICGMAQVKSPQQLAECKQTAGHLVAALERKNIDECNEISTSIPIFNSFRTLCRTWTTGNLKNCEGMDPDFCVRTLTAYDVIHNNNSKSLSDPVIVNSSFYPVLKAVSGKTNCDDFYSSTLIPSACKAVATQTITDFYSTEIKEAIEIKKAEDKAAKEAAAIRDAVEAPIKKAIEEAEKKAAEKEAEATKEAAGSNNAVEKPATPNDAGK